MGDVADGDREHAVCRIDRLHVHQPPNPPVAVARQLFAVVDTLNKNNFVKKSDRKKHTNEHLKLPIQQYLEA